MRIALTNVVGIAVLLVGSTLAQANLIANLGPASNPSIPEGSTVTFYSQVVATGGHIGGGSVGYSMGGPGAIVGGPGGYSLPDGPSSYSSPGNTTFVFYDNGLFSVSLSGGGNEHNSSHSTIWSGGFGTGYTVTVSNVPPTITGMTGNLQVAVNQTFPFSASATDPGGTYDPLTFSWDLNGDSTYGDYVGTSGSTSFSQAGSHVV